MTSNPSPIEPEGLFDGLRWHAILRGAVLDNVLTIASLFPIMWFVAGAGAFSDDEETARQAIDEALVSPEFLLWTSAVGAAITVYAAFWAARRAGVLHLRHGGWTAVASAALACLFLLLPGTTANPQTPLWHDALALALTVPSGLLGGWLASRLARG